jgi:hypothetical protein
VNLSTASSLQDYKGVLRGHQKGNGYFQVPEGNSYSYATWVVPQDLYINDMVCCSSSTVDLVTSVYFS